MHSKHCRITTNLRLEEHVKPRVELTFGRYCYQGIELRLVSELAKQVVHIGSIDLIVVPKNFLFNDRFKTLRQLRGLITEADFDVSSLQQQIVVYIANFHIRPMLRDDDIENALFEFFFDWLNNKPFKCSLLLNCSKSAVVKGDADICIKEDSAEYHQEKSNIEEWLGRFGFVRASEKSNDLMLWRPPSSDDDTDKVVA